MGLLQTLHELWEERMGWDEEERKPVEFMLCSYLSGFLPGATSTAWGDIVGPPAIGKTEILISLEDGDTRTIMVDNFTENAFTSAMKDPDNPEADYSLAGRLSDDRHPKGRKVMVVKDFSSMLGMRSEKMTAIFSLLRTAYDGGITTAAGSVEGSLDVKKNLNFGMLTACTEQLDAFRKHNQTLGERTLICRMGRELRSYASRERVAQHVVRVDPLQAEALRCKIKIHTKKLLDRAVKRIKEAKGRVFISDEYLTKLGSLAALASSIRTTPLSKFSFSNLSEGPGRIVGQLKCWGCCRVLLDDRKEWNERDYTLLRRIAQDTMPPEYLRAIHAIWRGSMEMACSPINLDQILKDTKVGGEFQRQLQQWVIIEILNEHEAGVYSMHPDFAASIKATGFMEGLS